MVEVHSQAEPVEASRPLSFQRRRESIPKRILHAAAFVGSLVTGVLAGEKLAKAQEATSFGPEINNIDPAWTGASVAQLMPGVTENRLRMSFNATTEVLGQDLYAAEFQLEIAEGGSLILRRLGSVQRLPISAPPEFEGGADGAAIEFNRHDGRQNTIQSPGYNEATGLPDAQLDMNGEPRWPVDCPRLGDYIRYAHRSENPNELVVLVPFTGPTGDELTDAWRVNINEPNYCTAIGDAIDAAEAAGQNMFEAGLLITRESTGARETRIAVDETFEAITRDTVDSQATWLYWIDLATGERRHLQRNPDGTWTEEVPQTVAGNSETTLGSAHAASSVIKRTIDGRVFHLYVFETVDPALYGGANILKVLALEETPPGSGIFTEVPVEMAEDPLEVDDDSDGRSNFAEGDSGCRWRANPGSVDVSGPGGIDVSDGKEDACQANCESGGWPGVDAAGETNASGLRVCESELGYANAFTDEDGSTYHSNMDVSLSPDGSIALSTGQTIRYIHSKDPRIAETPSRDIKFPDGNSLSLNIHDTTRLNGDPGTANLQYRPYEGYDPLAAPVEVTFDGPTEGVVDYPPAIGAVLGLEGSDVEVTAGSEGLSMDCPPICEPGPDGGQDGGAADAGPGDGGNPADAGEIPDGGTPDGGTPDGGTPDSGTPDGGIPDAATPTPDAGTPDSNQQTPEAGPADAGNPDAGQPQTDSGEVRPDGGPDAGPKPEQDSGQHSDSGNPGTDSGRVDTSDNNGNGNGGCSCEISGEISGQNKNSNPLDAAPIILTVAGLGTLSHRRRRKT